MNDIKIGACSLLWRNPNGDQFIPWLREVKELGYDGISGFADWGWEQYIEDGPAFNRMITDEGLELASLVVNMYFDFDRYRNVFKFMADNKCVNLICLGAYGKKDNDFKLVGEFLNYLGEEAKVYGIRVHYHHHTDNLGESYTDMQKLITATKPSLVSVMCDVGHATKDFVELPVSERATTYLEHYKDRLSMIEFKDYNDETGLHTPLGEGNCNYEGVFEFIRKNSYRGWLVVEQNGRSKGREPRECAIISRVFIRQGLGI